MHPLLENTDALHSTLFEPSNSAMAPLRMYSRILQNQLQAAVQAQVALSLEWRTSSLSTFVSRLNACAGKVCDREREFQKVAYLAIRLLCHIYSTYLTNLCTDVCLAERTEAHSLLEMQAVSQMQSLPEVEKSSLDWT